MVRPGCGILERTTQPSLRLPLRGSKLPPRRFALPGSPKRNAIMQTPPRRVVTGHAANGKSVILFDGPVAEGPVSRDRFVWTTAATPADNRGGTDAARTAHRLEPPAGGSVFRVVEFPP